MKSLYNVHTIWLLMMLLTAASYFVGDLGKGGWLAMLFVLVAAFIKGVFIIRDFMELKGVSLLWRAIMYGWLWVVCISISIAYFVSV